MTGITAGDTAYIQNSAVYGHPFCPQKSNARSRDAPEQNRPQMAPPPGISVRAFSATRVSFILPDKQNGNYPQGIVRRVCEDRSEETATGAELHEISRKMNAAAPLRRRRKQNSGTAFEQMNRPPRAFKSTFTGHKGGGEYDSGSCMRPATRIRMNRAAYSLHF